jgi:hypothetical protein
MTAPTDKGCSYGVGAGDSPGDGEGASVDPSVFGGFLFAPAALCRVRVGVGDGLLTAAVDVVAVVPCCCVQEATNATPMIAAIKRNMCLFMVCQLVRVRQNVWLLKKFGMRD